MPYSIKWSEWSAFLLVLIAVAPVADASGTVIVPLTRMYAYLEVLKLI